jgi:glycerophosphoryl diester phosphodiesterase
MAEPRPHAWPLPRWIAHRGAGRLAPENTLAAFRVGAAHGYRAFECDVKLSADGVPFLLHDATLERTTPERGTAGERPWAELSRIDAGGWHSRAFAGEPLPSLAAIAAYVQRNGFALNIEIKPTPGQEHATGRAVGAWCAAHWKPGGSPLLLSSFRPEALQGALEAAPALPRALLLDTAWDGWEAVARALQVVAVVTNQNIMDAALKQRLDALALRAACYTVNDPAGARRLLALGVDGLITDAVDRFSPAADGAAVFD